MSIEIQALVGVVVILLVLLSVQGCLVPINHGFKWGLGPRDEAKTPSIMQGRMRRIVANHMEGMAMFAPLVLVAHLGGISSPLTQWGAGLFVVGRAGFAIVYAMGLPVWRSAIWALAMIGLLLIGFEVIRSGF